MPAKLLMLPRISLLCIFLFVVSGCAAKPPINVIDEPTGISDAQKVRRAILTASNDLGWKTQERSDSEIEATLDHLRNQVVVVGIKYNADFYSMTFEKGENNSDEFDRTRWYRNWMHNLHKRIQSYLKMASF